MRNNKSSVPGLILQHKLGILLVLLSNTSVVLSLFPHLKRSITNCVNDVISIDLVGSNRTTLFLNAAMIQVQLVTFQLIKRWQSTLQICFA